MYRLSISIFFLSLFLFSCGEKSAKDQGFSFFNTGKLVEELSSELQSSSCGFQKVLIRETEEKTLLESSPVWKDELEIFLEFELNKNAYIGEYDYDTRPGGTRFELSNKNKNLKVKWQEIDFREDGSISCIRSYREDDNPLFRSEVLGEIFLNPDRTLRDFRLKFNKKVILLGPESFEVLVRPLDCE